MKILHINVRLNEGGAARVALDLHNRLSQNKIVSSFCYGYGKKTLKNPAESFFQNVYKCAGSLSIIINFITHKFFGIEFMPPLFKWKKILLSEIDKADIVHLHVIHSYYLPYKWLFNYLKSKNKKIVWTIHDYWALTGRCAFLDHCNNYITGCGNCLTNKNYPPAYIDFSKHEYIGKDSIIKSLASQLTLVCVSKHLADEYKIKYPNIDIRVILNGVDHEFEEIADNCIIKNKEFKHRHKVLIIANDLSYNGKTNQQIINAVYLNQDIEIHTIGKNSPFKGDNIINHGSILAREDLIQIYIDMDCMLFTSVVDTFGLVLIEALMVGLPIIALKSKAADEVLGLIRAKTLNIDEILQFNVKDVWQLYQQNNKYNLKEEAKLLFNGINMQNKYISLYQEL